MFLPTVDYPHPPMWPLMCTRPLRFILTGWFKDGTLVHDWMCWRHEEARSPETSKCCRANAVLMRAGLQVKARGTRRVQRRSAAAVFITEKISFSHPPRIFFFIRLVWLCFSQKNEMSGVYFWTAIKGNVEVHIHFIHKTERKGFLIMCLLIFALHFLNFLLPDLEKRCQEFNYLSYDTASVALPCLNCSRQIFRSRLATKRWNVGQRKVWSVLHYWVNPLK